MALALTMMSKEELVVMLDTAIEQCGEALDLLDVVLDENAELLDRRAHRRVVVARRAPGCA